MTREDFVFTIGYDGDNAVVDSKTKKKYKLLSTLELAEKGFFKPALSSAIFSGQDSEIDIVLEKYNKIAEKKVENREQLKLVLGVHRLPKEISKTVQI